MKIIWLMIPEILMILSATDRLFSHFGQFLPFYSLPPSITAQKMRKWKKWKHKNSTCIYHHLTQVNQKSWSYASLFRDMACNRCNCHFSFWAIRPINQNFKKMEKLLEISSIYTWAPKIMIRWRMVPEIWCATDGRTDRRTDEQTEKVTYRGGCPT